MPDLRSLGQDSMFRQWLIGWQLPVLDALSRLFLFSSVLAKQPAVLSKHTTVTLFPCRLSCTMQASL